MNHYCEPLPPSYLPLSAREKQIVRLKAEGISGEQIAALLGISPQTVRNHMQSIFGKLGIRTSAGAVVIDLVMREYLGEM